MNIRLNTFRIYILLPLLTLLLTACKEKEDEPVSMPVHRTVVVYMAADNSLGQSGFDEKDIVEMEIAISENQLQGGRLLLYHAATDHTATLYELTKGERKVLAVYGSDGLSSVHGDRMLNVLNDAKKFAPADQYGLVLWSHAMGWLQNGIDDGSYPRPGDDGTNPRRRTWGEENYRRMNITTLASVLEKTHFDFVYFDCCYMASVEVAYELRKATPYMVASCTELPADGMPYHRTLKHLFAPGYADLEDAARQTFEYYNSLEGSDRTCTISVIDLSALDELAAAARNIFGATDQRYPFGYIPQDYMIASTCRFSDLDHYMLALNDLNDDEAAKEANAAAWAGALNKAVIYKANTPWLWNRLRLDHHSGLSTYVALDADYTDSMHYGSLSWGYDSGRIVTE